MQTEKEKRFSDIFEASVEQVFRYVYVRTKDKELAEDITQTTFMKVYEKIDSIKEDKEKQYTITIAKNLLIDYYRKNKINIEYDETLPSCNPLEYSPHLTEEKIFKKEDIDFVIKIINQLEPYDGELVRLRAILEWSYKEISEYLETNEATIRKQYSRALEKLREIIINKYPKYERFK